jgi:hypothetical protein
MNLLLVFSVQRRSFVVRTEKKISFALKAAADCQGQSTQSSWEIGSIYNEGSSINFFRYLSLYLSVYPSIYLYFYLSIDVAWKAIFVESLHLSFFLKALQIALKTCRLQIIYPNETSCLPPFRKSQLFSLAVFNFNRYFWTVKILNRFTVY